MARQHLHDNPVFKKTIALFMIWLVLILPLGSASVSISQIVPAPNTNSAVITFKTNESATALVSVNGVGNFPNTPTSPRTDHSVQVTGLAPDTLYTYTVQAATLTSTQPVVSTAAQFRTLAASGELFFTSNLPSVTGASRISMAGKTVADAFVTVSVNDQIAASGVATATGDVALTFNLDTNLEQNAVVVQVRDAVSSQTKDFPYTIQIDTLFPEITNLTIPSVSESTSVQISGIANKPMTVMAYARYANGEEKEFGPVDASADAEFTIGAELDEGTNQVLVRATDSAGAQVEDERSVVVDSEELELDFDFSRYDPVASSTLYIDGFVNKPGISVRVYVDPKDKRIGNCDTVDSVTVTPSQTIDDSRCYGFRRFDQVTVDGAYFEEKSSTAPNDQGMYPVSIKVLLEPRLSIFVQDKLGVGVSSAESALDAMNQEDRYRAGVDIGLADEYALFAVAVDNVGRVESTATARIRKEQCGDTGDFMVRIGQVYPDLIQPDHIFQGIAQISFKADLQYTGIGDPDSVVITGADITPRVVSDFDLEKLGTDPQEILDPGRCTISPASGITDYVYMVCDLNRFPTSEVRTNITAAYKKLEDIGSIKFPVTFNVDYSLIDQNGRSVARTATQCVDISIRFDKRLSPDKLPKGLLKSTVNVLNTTVDSIDKVLKPLNTIKLVTLGACAGSKIFSLFAYTTEEFTCKTTDGFSEVEMRKIEQTLRGCKSLEDAECTQRLNQIRGESADKSSASSSTCAQKINSRLKTEMYINGICDRIFCPAVPSATEYVEQVNNRGSKAMTSACSRSSENLWGAPGAVSAMTKEQGCGKEYYTTWRTACPSVDPLQLSKEQVKAESERKTFSFQNVLSNMNFCSAAQNAQSDKADMFTTHGVTYYNDDKTDPTSCYRLGVPISSADFDKGKGLVVNQDSQRLAVNPVRVSGLSNSIARDGVEQPCVVTGKDGTLQYQFKSLEGNPLKYDGGKAEVVSIKDQADGVSVVKFSTDANQAAVNAALDGEGNYYKLDGNTWTKVDSADENFFTRVCTNAVTPGSTVTEFGIAKPGNDKCKPITQAPQELNQNVGKKTIIDPTDGFINSLRCGCIPAIEGYLIVMRNVLNAVKNCFQATLVNGEFKAGACRSLLTTYICDWIYRAIKCITAFAGGLEKLSKAGNEANQNAIGAIQSLQKGADRMSKAMQDRYGNSATYSSLIGSRKLINSVCLAAFGYDWMPELDQAVSIRGGGAAINSTAFIVTADRRWLSSDPTTGDSTFIYEAGYFISAGSPITYRIELICSNDYSCKQSDGYDSTGACDCAHGASAAEKSYQIDAGVAEGGSTVGDADGKGQKLIKLGHSVRYDTVRLTFVDQATPGSKPQTIEKKISRIGGQEPPTCTFSLITLQFKCDYATTNKYGDVFFYGEGIKFLKDPYDMGDNLDVSIFARESYIKKVGVNDEPLPSNERIPKYAKLQVYNEQGTELIAPIEVSSKNELTKLLDGTPLQMGQNLKLGSGTSPAGVKGTVRASDLTYSLSDTAEQLDVNPTSLTASRATSKFAYYVIHGYGTKQSGPIAKQYTAIDNANFDNKKYVVVRQDINTGFNQRLGSIDSINLELEKQRSASTSTVGTSLSIYSVVPTTVGSKVTINLERNGAGPLLQLDSIPTAPASIVLVYDSQDISGLLCKPGQTSIKFNVTVTLHDGMAKDKKTTISPLNSVPNPAVFIYQGKPQVKSQLIEVRCSGTSATSTTVDGLRRCTPNAWNTVDQWRSDGTTKEGCWCDSQTKANVFIASNNAPVYCRQESSGTMLVKGACSSTNGAEPECWCGNLANIAGGVYCGTSINTDAQTYTPSYCILKNDKYSCEQGQPRPISS